MGVDNVLVEGERMVCDPLGILNPPNGVGNSLALGKSAALDLSWAASPVDGSHDAPSHYRLFSSTAPDRGFAVEDTATITAAISDLDPVTEFFKVSAVNAAGTSGDEPMP